MNEQTQSFLRTVLKIGGAVAIQKGYTDSANAEIIIGGIVALIGVVWSAWHHKPAAK